MFYSLSSFSFIFIIRILYFLFFLDKKKEQKKSRRIDGVSLYDRPFLQTIRRGEHSDLRCPFASYSLLRVISTTLKALCPPLLLLKKLGRFS